MKTAHIIGVLIIAGFVGFGATAFKGASTQYVSFAQARAATSRVQVMGKVDLASIKVERTDAGATAPANAAAGGGQAGTPETLKPGTTWALHFNLKDDKGDTMAVVYPQPEPGNFRQAKEVVVAGRYDGSVFNAERLLVKCPSKYENKASEHPSDVPVTK